MPASAVARGSFEAKPHPGVGPHRSAISTNVLAVLLGTPRVTFLACRYPAAEGRAAADPLADRRAAARPDLCKVAGRSPAACRARQAADRAASRVHLPY